jgi:hypothetical protein
MRCYAECECLLARDARRAALPAFATCAPLLWEG